jgi:hypothetical protein
MRDNRIMFLKIQKDSNASEDPGLAPMVPSEAAESESPASSLSARSGSWHGTLPDHKLAESMHSKSFSDGTLIETVRDPQRSEEFRLLVFKDQEALITNRFEYDGDHFVPGELDRNFAQYVRLAAGISRCGKPRELLADLVATIRKHVDLPDDVLQVIAAFVLCSWFPDRLRFAPYLWLVGPLSSGKTTILKLLHGLCRRAFLVGDLTPASLYQLPSLLKPTLLIDENDLGGSVTSAPIQRLLRTGNTPGTPAIRNARAFETYCVKVLASRQPPSDAALASRSIIIPTSPSTRLLAPLDQAALERIALEFQPKLLMYRLQNFHNLYVSDVFSSRIGSMVHRTRDIAEALAAPLLGDTELENCLIDVLDQQDHDARIQQSLEPEWLVMETLYDLCHQDDARPRRFLRKTCSIPVGGIAKMINQRMENRGEDVRVPAKKTGLILRGLGIRTTSLGNQGRGIQLTSVVREKVHKLSRQFGFNRRNLLSEGDQAEYGGAPCALCEKYGLTAGLKFVALPEWTPTRSIRARRALFEEESTTGSSESS